MSKDPTNHLKGPTVMYGPVGESQIFHHHNDIPEGWADDPLKHAPADPANITPLKTVPMTRAEIVEALVSGGVEFKKNAGAASLYELLTVNVIAALTEAKIEFDPAADTKTLMGLLPQPE